MLLIWSSIRGAAVDRDPEPDPPPAVENLGRSHGVEERTRSWCCSPRSWCRGQQREASDGDRRRRSIPAAGRGGDCRTPGCRSEGAPLGAAHDGPARSFPCARQRRRRRGSEQLGAAVCNGGIPRSERAAGCSYRPSQRRRKETPPGSSPAREPTSSATTESGLNVGSREAGDASRRSRTMIRSSAGAASPRAPEHDRACGASAGATTTRGPSCWTKPGCGRCRDRGQGPADNPANDEQHPRRSDRRPSR